MKRSIYKSITWRIIATLVTMTIGYIATGDMKIASTIGVIDAAIKFVLYYAHERLWEKDEEE